MSAPDAAAAAAAAAASASPPVAPPAERSPSEVEELTKKVFVRPLAAALSEDDIKSLFPELTVTEVQVMRRGARHLGYGFITFASAAEAETALERSAQSSAGDAVKVERLKHTATESAAARKARTTREPKKKAAPKTKRAPEAETASGETKPAAKTRAKTALKPSAPPASPSETLVFVANVDWAVGPKELQEFFEKDTDLKVEQVTIASQLVRVPPPAAEESPAANESTKKRVAVRRSRGYAFVRFASHEQQGKAIEQFDGKELRGRPVVLKIALEKERKKSSVATENGKTEAIKTDPEAKQALAQEIVTV